MNIEVFSLCDAATVDVGKLNILGAFDTIWTVNMPAVHPQCAIALRVRFENIERGEHRVTVNFVDLDGRHIIPSANGTININFPNEQRSGSANLILNMQMLKLEKYGEYSIDLAIDGRSLASLPLFVRARR
ncbi:MAG: hypothetical protein A2166_03705 [Omnitrophica WOR_2 bacterium RBG_13_41_10]|nr:MAG: hypothetical protein A2166_03705 [Omnitrophica WOR_2 bacterium RBG_13_41_10]